MENGDDAAQRLLRTLFQPSSIAVIGASDDKLKISGRPLDSLQRLGFAGRILAVNPNREQVQGLPAYPDLDAIDGDIDLAIVAVNAERTPAALRACAARGVGVAIAFAAGFAEGGDGGAALQAEIAEICRSTGLRLLGPNCLGAVGIRDRVTATFSSLFDEGEGLRPGHLALVSQSGAFGTFILSAAQSEGLGFSHFANTGNEVDLTVADLLLTLAESPDVAVLLAYFEGVADGPALVRAARRAAELGKPIVAVKSGRSAAGARAVSSHTASLAGADAVFDAVTRQLGIIRVPSMEPLIDVARLLLDGRRAAGRRLTVLSLSGGAGALMTDLAVDAGLQVHDWEPPWRERMAGAIPVHGSTRNPVDLTGSLISEPAILEGALDVALEHPATDILVVLLGNIDRGAERLVAAVHDAYRRAEVPMAVVWTGGSGRPRATLTELGVPCFTDPARAAVALGALADHSLRPPPGPRPDLPDVDPAAARAVLERVRAAGRLRFDELESAELLGAYGIASPPAATAADPDEAVAVAQRLGHPVAVKALSSQVTHKSDLGAVRLGLDTAADVCAAATDVLAAARTAGAGDARVLVQRMAAPGVELVLGINRDATFGPVVLTGLGGVLVEVLADTAIALPPLDVAAAERALRSLRGAVLLDGVRGAPPCDVPAAADALVRLSLLAADLGTEIAELDVNPLLVSTTGAVAVDGFVLLEEVG